MISLKLDKIKTKEYKYPYEVYKVPVQTGLFDHFIMPALLKMSKFCFQIHHNINDYPAKNVKAMKTRDAKEITTERWWSNLGYMHFVQIYLTDKISA